jgi:SAM-dependent methyltransferase
MASAVRAAGYRLLTPLDRAARSMRGALIPPAHLRVYYYRVLNPAAYERACQTARAELIAHGLQPEHRLLDVGCGVGNLALGIADYLRGTYEGIDIHGEAIAWCREAITPRHPRFRFHHADLASAAYNPRGSADPGTFAFPFPDRDFDFVFLGSVFTHMLPDDVAHYVSEIARVLRPGGTCVASCFLLNDETRAPVEAGRSFVTFPVRHESGLCRLHDATKPEAAVALEESFLHTAYGAASLEICGVRRGQWWNGRMDDQDIVTALAPTSPFVG